MLHERLLAEEDAGSALSCCICYYFIVQIRIKVAASLAFIIENSSDF